MNEYIALVYDPDTESDLVFHVNANNRGGVPGQVKGFYRSQGWSTEGIIIKAKILRMPEGKSIQMIGHRYVRGLEAMSEREKIAVLHKDL